MDGGRLEHKVMVLYLLFLWIMRYYYTTQSVCGSVHGTEYVYD